MDLINSSLVVLGQLLLVDDTRLLLELLVDSEQLLPFLLVVVLLSLVKGQSVSQLTQFLVFIFILFFNVLELFSGVTQNDHCGRDLGSKLVELLISFFDFFIKSLVFDFQLLEIDQMESVCQLLLLLQDFLLVGESVSQSDVLKSVLMHFLIFELLRLFPFIECFLGNGLASSGEHSIFSHTSLQLFELLLDFVTFSLFFIQFSLKFRSHFVVTVLSLFKIDSHLMNIRKSVQVLVLIHLNVRLTAVLLEVGIHHNDLFLQLFILSLELVLLSQFFLNGLDKISFHFVLTWQLFNFVSRSLIGL